MELVTNDSFLRDKQLIAVRKYLSRIPNINSGGCGLAALVMYDTLVSLGYKPKIIYGYYYLNGSYRTNKLAKRKLNTFTSASHIFLSLNDTCFDSNTIIDKKIEFMRTHVMNRKILIESLKHGNWNERFSFDKYLKIFKEKFGLSGI